MTTGNSIMNQLSCDAADASIGLRIKAPKLVVGFLELGLSATYDLQDETVDKSVGLLSTKRLGTTLTVKDTLLRGRFDLEPQERKLHYSKKLRLPFLNTELFKVRLTAQLPGPGNAGAGLLTRGGLGVTFNLQPERLHASSIVRKAPDYSLQVAPRVGPPQALYNKIGFPGSLYVKANTTLHLSDGAAAKELRARLQVHSLRATLRLYDVSRVKPCRLGRGLGAEVERLAADGEATAGSGRRQGRAAGAQPEAAWPSAAAAGGAEDYPQHDIIDAGAAKVREWAHAVLVNSCIATEHLKESAAAAWASVRGQLEPAK